MSEKYRCKYEYSIDCGEPTHLWILVGRYGGLHLSIREGKADKDGTPRYYGGFEMHSRTPLSDTAPDRDKCWLLQCPCWTSGSSMAADEVWIPRWLDDPGNHDRMFRFMAVEADKRFSEHERKDKDDE